MKNINKLNRLCQLLYDRNGIDTTAYEKDGKFFLDVLSKDSKKRVLKSISEIIKVFIPELYTKLIRVKIDNEIHRFKYKKWWEFRKKYDPKRHPMSRFSF